MEYDGVRELFSYLAGRKSAGLKSELRVSADRSQLDGQGERDLLVQRGSAVGGGVLVLLKRIDLGVDGGLGAEDRGLANGSSVSFLCRVRVQSFLEACPC